LPVRYFEINIFVYLHLSLSLFSADISDDDRLPQFVCIKCKRTLDNFSLFSCKVKSFQQELKDNLPSSTTVIKEEAEYEDETPITFENSYEDMSIIPTPYFPSYGHDIVPDLPFEDVASEIILGPDGNDTADITREQTFTDALSSPIIPLPKNNNLEMLCIKHDVKPCSINLHRIPVVFYPDSDSECDNIEEMFSKDLPMETSSPIVQPRFYIVSCCKDKLR
jgi:hypothetical protein